MLKWQASFHGFIAKSREKRPADKGKQLKQQVQSITTRDERTCCCKGNNYEQRFARTKSQKHDQSKAGRDCQNGISLGNVKWAGGKTKSR